MEKKSFSCIPKIKSCDFGETKMACHNNDYLYDARELHGSMQHLPAIDPLSSMANPSLTFSKCTGNRPEDAELLQEYCIWRIARRSVCRSANGYYLTANRYRAKFWGRVLGTPRAPTSHSSEAIPATPAGWVIMDQNPVTLCKFSFCCQA
jgi:hypothetical protein